MLKKIKVISNLLIGDNENNIIERFEPYGSVINEKVHKKEIAPGQKRIGVTGTSSSDDLCFHC